MTPEKPARLKHIAVLEDADPAAVRWRCLCGWTLPVGGNRRAAENAVEDHVHGLDEREGA